ncbi:NAD(P)/FAD-dependent oxidoreductase, partial [Novosphingobium sp.]|uniref:NAD(P)/FAD-dependent oxidoreductase n=1 Tax=Novosphingobium sp. TaxID=1874826 RepID=UPI002B475971
MPDALILGGGLAGSATAVLLARTGQSVHLIERETGPHHKICGEFLSIEAHQHLSELGIDPLALGAVPIERIHLIFGNAFIEAPLPFKALGLSRYTLDETLIGQATAAGAKVERGVRVLEIGQDQVRTSAGARSGRHVILATGKLPVRQEQHPRRKEDDNPYVGFKMHYRLGSAARRRLDGVIQLILFDGGYAGLQLIEGGHANLCLIIRRRRLQQLGRKWADVAKMLTSLKHCRTILTDAEPLF